MNLKPIRIRKRGKGPQRRLVVNSHIEQREAACPDDHLVIRVPADMAKMTRAIAKYEERSHATVLRSLLSLGLRVYRTLSDEISPYAPASVDVTDAEINATCAEIRSEVSAPKVSPWAKQIKVNLQRVADDAFVID